MELPSPDDMIVLRNSFFKKKVDWTSSINLSIIPNKTNPPNAINKVSIFVLVTQNLITKISGSEN